MRVAHLSLFLSALLAVCLQIGDSVRGQELIEQRPFDRIRLNNGTSYEVDLLPERRMPSNPTGSVEARLLENDKKYLIKWSSIAGIDFYEDMLLKEAERIRDDATRQDRFDRAYPYYARLIHQYPQTQGLQRSRQIFLYLNAASLVGAGDYAEALGIMEELYRINPAYRHSAESPPLLAIMSDRVLAPLLRQYIEEKHDFASAQRMIRRLERQYGADAMDAVTRWRGVLQRRAVEMRDRARELAEQDKLREARQASKQMLALWPDVEGGRELALEIARRFPLVVVGVARHTAEPDPRRIEDWAARRVARLQSRSLVEFEGVGPSAGEYAFPLGELRQSYDRRQLSFIIDPARGATDVLLTGYDISRQLRQLADPADPTYDASWGSLLSHVEVPDVFQADITFRRPHISPEAMLQIPLAVALSEDQRLAAQPYFVAAASEQETLYRRNPQYRFGPASASGGGSVPPAEVIERQFADSQKAVTALHAGEIDVVDDLAPADAARLLDEPSIVLERYALPTVHVLLPNYTRPYTASRDFRRGLVYGISRGEILSSVLLKGRKLPGCQVISGPFSAGIAKSDPLAYAYDDSLEVRPYLPRLALMLTHLTEHQLGVAATDRGDTPPPFPQLVLGYPAAEVPRLACRAIANRLQAIGIPCTLHEFSPGQTRDIQGDCDLVYAELAMWEPMIDAPRLLGPDGLARIDDPYVQQALLALDSVTNETQRRDRLRDLHRVVYENVSVIPLWQTVHYLAHHDGIRRGTNAPVTLYQDIDHWQIAPR